MVIYLALLHIPHPILDSSLNLCLSFNEPSYISNTDVLRALCWASNAAGEKCLSPMPRMGIEIRSLDPKSDTLLGHHKSRLVQQGCTSIDILSSTAYVHKQM